MHSGKRALDDRPKSGAQFTKAARLKGARTFRAPKWIAAAANRCVQCGMKRLMLVVLLLAPSLCVIAAPVALQSQPPPSLSPPNVAASGAAADVLPEVEVLGEQPGPGLWKITRADHVLWLLGTLDHVPRRMTWRSHQVESVLNTTQQVLASNPGVSARYGPILLVRMYVQWRGLQKVPDRTQLRDWLTPALYARFEAQKTRFDAGDGRIERLRPPFAALRLYQRALDAVGLTRTNEIEQTVLALAARRGVAVIKAPLRVQDPLGTLKQVRALSPADEVNCLASTMQRLETDLPVMQQRARAWAVGDVSQLQALPFEDQREACISDLSAASEVRALVDAATRSWLQTADAMLATNRVSFAMQPIYSLLAPDGPLAHFRAQGDRVESPE
jgi:uncharacterized protein YbaP (TraB family)